MLNKLNYEEIIYRFNFDDIDFDCDGNVIPEYEEVYTQIKTALNINGEGYNVYIVDEFSNDKINNLKEYINNILRNKPEPRDICYVVKNEPKNPISLYLPNGEGKILKDTIKQIQKCYADIIYDFYNSETSTEKEDLLNRLEKNRSILINELIESAKSENFEINSGSGGFTFMPLKNNKVMTEEEYDLLLPEEKENIISKVSELKNKAKEILKKLTDIEINEIKKLKDLLKDELIKKTKEIEVNYINDFKESREIIEYIEYICRTIEKELINNYTSIYDDDETEIKNIIYKYEVNILVDNSNIKSPRVIYEDNPSLSNLFGSIEAENINGSYSSDINSIKAGSLLKANDGCLILRLNDLMSHQASYYYLKKAILSKKIDLNYNKGYLDLIAPINLKPKSIDINEKVIIIGDYRSYEILSNYDEDFKKVFKIKAESNPLIDINKKTKDILISHIIALSKKNNFKTLTNDAVEEIAKYLSRKAENRNKIYFDCNEISKTLTMANQKVIEEEKNEIDSKDIFKVIYPENLIEKHVFEMYENSKILFTVKDKCVGKINGLSVIDTGDIRFGRPIRITCCCYKGHGDIIEVQKESKLSGNIHDKAVNTLKGFIYNYIGGYENLTVDFHLSFEQIYGIVDGDSASVAEVISMMSALSKVPINQNIAVTGSINQFGEIQPIGGVNEKIEGFYKVCKIVDNIEDKGVLIPKSNKDDLVLNPELEEAILKGKFSIYTMEDIDDAIDLLIGSNDLKANDIMDIMKKELFKYLDKKKRK